MTKLLRLTFKTKHILIRTTNRYYVGRIQAAHVGWLFASLSWRRANTAIRVLRYESDTNEKTKSKA